ncbi:hypothetical protein ACIRPN_31460 [Streptomyces sp. NPDC101230]|uniref:hypothetical protein n=1 Tax=unclassified Streptomyces TaxID=2593676 RepID=UPI00381B5322
MSVPVGGSSRPGIACRTAMIDVPLPPLASELVTAPDLIGWTAGPAVAAKPSLTAPTRRPRGSEATALPRA